MTAALFVKDMIGFSALAQGALSMLDCCEDPGWIHTGAVLGHDRDAFEETDDVRIPETVLVEGVKQRLLIDEIDDGAHPCAAGIAEGNEYQGHIVIRSVMAHGIPFDFLGRPDGQKGRVFQGVTEVRGGGVFQEKSPGNKAVDQEKTGRGVDIVVPGKMKENV